MISLKLKSGFVFYASILIIGGIPGWSQDSKLQADSNLIEKQRSQACEALKNNQASTATATFKSIVEQNPNDAQSNMDYGSMLFASAAQYYTRGHRPAFSNEAMPILQTAVIYLEKAVKLFNVNDTKERLLKSHACYLLGDIYHYGYVPLSQAEDKYQMSLSLYPQNETVQKELSLVQKKEQKTQNKNALIR